MKKNFVLSLAVMLMLSLMAFTSCDKKAKEEAKYDEQITQLVSGLTFPQKLVDNTNLTGCTYVGKVLTYKVEIEKKQLDEMKLDEMKLDEKRAQTLEKLRTGLLPRALLQSLVKAQASLQYIYYNDKDSVSFIYAPSELKLN